MASSPSSVSSSCSSFIATPVSAASQSSGVSQSSQLQSRNYTHPVSEPQHFLPTEVWLEIVKYAVSTQGEKDPALSVKTLCALRGSGQFFAGLVDDNAILAMFWRTLAIDRPCPTFKRLISEAAHNAYAALQPGEEAPTFPSRFHHLTQSFIRRGVLPENSPILFHPCQYDVAMLVLDGNLERMFFKMIGQNTGHNAKEIRQRIDVPREQRSGFPFVDLTNCNLDVLPPEIAVFTELQQLNLSMNSLRTLPPEIGQLVELRNLRALGNQLTTVPPEIGNLTQLTHLRLENNQLTTLPSEIGRLKNLDFLSVAFNNRFTALPIEITHLSQLEHLDLRDTPLADTYPAGFSPEMLEFVQNVPQVQFHTPNANAAANPNPNDPVPYFYWGPA